MRSEVDKYPSACASRADVATLAVAAQAAAEGADMPRSIWGTDNPGQGTSHAAKPLSGAEHNNAGATHTDNRGGAGEEGA